MIPSQTPNFFQLLGDPVRWQLLTALSKSDLHVQELVERVGRPQNAVSYHLNLLQKQGLVREQRSIADGREIYYSLDLERVSALYRSAGKALHPALSTPDPAAPDRIHPAQHLRVLYLCTHNSARSQIAEGILRQRTNGQIEVFSAGTQPGTVHPLAVRAMAEAGIDIRRQRSKHLSEYIDQAFDTVVTVCDRARGTCPVFPGAPEVIHWSIPDPASVEGDEITRLAAFRQTVEEIDRRVGYFLPVLQRVPDLSSP
jgi:protein-tyrosine-phosphatase/DNA-binding transcriptional ArsR family regulator